MTQLLHRYYHLFCHLSPTLTRPVSPQVIIVGSGPAGLIIALLLAQKGIRSTVLEKAEAIDRNPRASHYSSPTIYELRRAGLMEDLMRDAFVPNGVAWRALDDPSETVAAVRADNPPGGETIVALPLDRLLPLMAAHLARHPAGRVLFRHEVVAIGQDEARAWVDVETPDGRRRMEADYVVGCDGANSRIRRELFGSSFPGFTWDKQIVATNVGSNLCSFFFLSSMLIYEDATVLLSQVQGLQVDGLDIPDTSGTLSK